MTTPRPAAAAACLALALTACGGDGDDAGEGAPDDGPRTVSTSGGEALAYGDTATYEGTLDGRGGVAYELEITVDEPVEAGSDDLAELARLTGYEVPESATIVSYRVTLVGIDDEAETGFLTTMNGNGVAATAPDGTVLDPVPLYAGEDDYPACPPAALDLDLARVGETLEFCNVYLDLIPDDEVDDSVAGVRFHPDGRATGAPEDLAVTWS